MTGTTTPVFLPYLSAIIAALEAETNHKVYAFEPDETLPEFPYYVVWGSVGDPSGERALDGAKPDLNSQVGLTAVAGTHTGVMLMQGVARQAVDRLDMRPPGVPGAEVYLSHSNTPTVDREVVIPATGNNPIYAVDMYRLRTYA